MNYDPWSPRAANYDELRRLPCLLMMMNYDEGLADGFLVSYYDDAYDPPDPSLKSSRSLDSFARLYLDLRRRLVNHNEQPLLEEKEGGCGPEARAHSAHCSAA